MEAIEAILTRTSVRRFRDQPVDRDVVLRLLESAVRAPNHKLTEPWRFVVLTGRARDQFAEIRAGHRLKRFPDPATAEAQAASQKVLQESRQIPVQVIVSMVVSADERTREEDYAATMMAVQNFLVAAQALGLGSYLRTGALMRDPSLLSLAGIPDDQRVVGIISLGYPAEAELPRRRRPPADLTRWIGD
jgi:nitroreductase